MSNRARKRGIRPGRPRRNHRRWWLVYDGRCAVCRALTSMVASLDLLGRVQPLDLHTQAHRVTQRAPRLDRDTLLRAVHLVSPQGEVWAGFEAVRRLAVIVPALWPLLPTLYAPGSSLVGPLVYDWVARNRLLRSICGPGAACPVHVKPHRPAV